MIPKSINNFIGKPLKQHHFCVPSKMSVEIAEWKKEMSGRQTNDRSLSFYLETLPVRHSCERMKRVYFVVFPTFSFVFVFRAFKAFFKILNAFLQRHENIAIEFTTIHGIKRLSVFNKRRRTAGKSNHVSFYLFWVLITTNCLTEKKKNRVKFFFRFTIRDQCQQFTMHCNGVNVTV